MSPDDIPFWVAVDGIRARQPRYSREAYGFVMLALGRVVERLPDERRQDPQMRHITGQELLRGVVDLARAEFGVMAPMVFGEWGLQRAADLGEIVFELVGAGQLNARPEDRREDFHGPELRELLSVDFTPPSAADAPEGPRTRRAADPQA